jgi:hypothetical protein
MTTSPAEPKASTVPPVDSPYRYPYGHLHHGQTDLFWLIQWRHDGLFSDGSEPNVVHEQLALRIYAIDKGAMVSDSTLSPPLRRLHFQGLGTISGLFYRRAMCLVGDVVAYPDSTVSIQFSHGHPPVSLPSVAHQGQS